MYHAVSFCLVTSLDLHLWHISHKPTGSELSQENTVKTKDICDIVPQKTHWLAFYSAMQTSLSLLLNLLSANTPSIFGVNSQPFDKPLVPNKHQTASGHIWKRIKMQNHILMNDTFLKSTQAVSDQRTVGNLRSTQEKPQRTKTLVSMPTRPLLGDSCFQEIFIQHLRCSLREGLAGFERRWVVGGGKEMQLC